MVITRDADWISVLTDVWLSHSVIMSFTNNCCPWFTGRHKLSWTRRSLCTPLRIAWSLRKWRLVHWAKFLLLDVKEVFSITFNSQVSWPCERNLWIHMPLFRLPIHIIVCRADQVENTFQKVNLIQCREAREIALLRLPIAIAELE